MSGGPVTISGEFELEGRHFTFDGETLFEGETALVTHNYSSGLMGVGEYFALSDLDGEFILALRPSRFNKLIIASASETVGEITYSMFNGRPKVKARQDLPGEYVLLCIWVAMRRMIG